MPKTAKLSLLHIPKTGGCSRAYTLYKGGVKDQVNQREHTMRVSDAPKGTPVIAYVRHPVTRYESAYASSDVTLPPIDELVEEEDVAVYGLELTTRPQVWWVNRPKVILRTTEMMWRTWAQLMHEYGIKASPLPLPRQEGYHSDRYQNVAMSERSVHTILERYSGDYTLWLLAVANEPQV
jgi:hypothetical protein